VFNTRSNIGGMYEEQIRRGAFSRAIREKQDAKFLWNHDASLILARVLNKTLELSEDSKGLRFRCDVARTTTGDDLLELVRRGDLNECSFGFVAITDEWTQEKNGGQTRYLRTLVDCDLFDVSGVTYPAYEGTSIIVDENDEASRMAFMFASGAPAGAPVELRSRISRACQISDSEFMERFNARKQAERLLPIFDDDGNRERFATLATLTRTIQ
jgi:HK97 family phage prohead protease